MKTRTIIQIAAFLGVVLPGLFTGYGVASGQPLISGDSDTKGQVPLIRLAASFSETPDLADYSVIYFNEKATVEFDGQLDALKLMNTDASVPSFFSITPGGTNLSINAMPPITGTFCKVGLGLKADKSGSITVKIRDIEASLSGYGIYLEDVVEGTRTSLLPDVEYRISIPAGEYKGRFFITLSDISTDVIQYKADDILNVYQSAGVLFADIKSLPGESGTFTILSLMGYIHHTEKVYESGLYEFSPALEDGIYIVSFASGHTRTSKKIFFHNQSKRY